MSSDAVGAGDPSSGVKPLYLAVPVTLFFLASARHLFEDTTHQWLINDYAMRVTLLAYVLLVPDVRRFALTCFRMPWAIHTPLQRGLRLVAVIVLLFVVSRLSDQIFEHLNSRYPETVFFDYFEIEEPWLLWFDLTVGLMLVALSEELVFRAFLKTLLARILNNPAFIILASAVVFGLFHWPSGIGHVVGTTVVGIAMMAIYIKSRSLWPIVTAHYLINLYVFGVL